MSLAGKVVLVAGGGRGAGRAAALALAAHGARLAVNDINADDAAETVRLIRAAGGQALEHPADISSKFAVQTMFNAIEDAWGAVDVLINNARAIPRKPLLEMDEWDWRRTLDVNLTGAFLLLQVAGRVMRASGGGVIINILRAPGEMPGHSAYLASQSALRALTEAARQELSGDGVAVVAMQASDGGWLQEIMAMFVPA
jgi:NAD(P)-dependent dehydrogenase (short-subunit alcohol dehydrogenase family)